MMLQALNRTLLAVSLVCAAFVANISTANADWEGAAKAADEATGNILQVLENETLHDEAHFAQLLVEIDAALSPTVDFPYIARRVMGKYYRRATEEQRTQFSEVFKTTLLKTYARALLGFEITNYRIEKPAKPSPKPEKQAVPVVVTSANDTEYTLVYFMLKQKDRWALVNASLDGINLRLTFKNQFASIAQDNRGNVGDAITAWQRSVSPASEAGQ